MKLDADPTTFPRCGKTCCRGNRHDAIQQETARCILLGRRTPGIIDVVNSLRRCLTGSRTVLDKLTRNPAKRADWRFLELAEADTTDASFSRCRVPPFRNFMVGKMNLSFAVRTGIRDSGEFRHFLFP